MKSKQIQDSVGKTLQNYSDRVNTKTLQICSNILKDLIKENEKAISQLEFWNNVEFVEEVHRQYSMLLQQIQTDVISQVTDRFLEMKNSFESGLYVDTEEYDELSEEHIVESSDILASVPEVHLEQLEEEIFEETFPPLALLSNDKKK